MFIHEMTRVECDDLLARAKVGRLGSARDNQPYVLPLNFAFDGGNFLYGFTTLGQKVEWMRSNPLVCFEIDEIKDHNNWSSVIVFGQYEELPDTPGLELARKHAHGFLEKRAMWWEPAYISQAHRDNPHPATPIFFRIRMGNVTGHRANSDESEMAIAASLAGLLPAPQAETPGRKSEWTRILKAALVYFAIVFGAGLLLGPIRILLVAPRVGERVAELLEAPLMLIVIIVAANWIVRKFQLPPRVLYRLGAGLIAFMLALVFELGLVWELRGLTLTEYFVSRDAVATTVYYLLLVLFALMPLLVKRHMHIR